MSRNISAQGNEMTVADQMTLILGSIAILGTHKQNLY